MILNDCRFWRDVVKKPEPQKAFAMRKHIRGPYWLPPLNSEQLPESRIRRGSGVLILDDATGVVYGKRGTFGILSTMNVLKKTY